MSRGAGYRVFDGSIRHAVVVETGPDGSIQVELDGELFTVEGFLESDDDDLSLRVNGRCVHIEHGPTSTRVNGITPSTSIVDEQRGNDGRSLARQKEGTLSSPMPGRVLRVMAKPNDSVMRTSPLVVVEAMKMENQLFSPIDGTVEAVFVEVGQTVEAGAVLVRVVPA